MRWIWYFLAALWVLDALKLRSRLASIKVLKPSAELPAPDDVFIAAGGVTVDDETRSAAVSHARENGLDFLDLVPADLPAMEGLRFVQVMDPKTYRANRVGGARTTGYAALAKQSLLERAGISEVQGDAAALIRMTRKLKRYSLERGDMAVAPALKAGESDRLYRWTTLSAAFGPRTSGVLRFRAIVLALIVAGPFVAPAAGLLALATYHLQVLLAFAGLPLRPRDLALALVFRTPIELWSMIQTLTSRPRPDPDPFEVRRPYYQRLLANGVAGFFEPRRQNCPLCSSPELKVWLHARDMVQSKPGRFTLERCGNCGHIFQNPRLSPAGLEFYYGDCYDGLGAEDAERLFEMSPSMYNRRARSVASLIKPRRWLDVGAGHGHFCCAAKVVWPETQFDGVDIGQGIEEAMRSGWVSRGYLGFLPQIAPRIAGFYDVVSFFHCLEHTPDPRAEIAAARATLAPDGLLVIEVPNPECPLGRWLGRYWFPWFQPQHLHLLSEQNLTRLLRETGFEVACVMRAEVHMGCDLLPGMTILYKMLAPVPDLPWRPRATRLSRLRYAAVWNLGFPLIMLAWFMDHALSSAMRRLGMSNAYGVIARRVESTAQGVKTSPSLS